MTELKKLVFKENLIIAIDTLRTKCPNLQGFTCSNPSMKIQCRLDYLTIDLKGYVRWPIGAKHNSISVLKHNNLLKNTTISLRTQQSFSEHNNIFENTAIDSGSQQSFPEHKEIS